MHIDTTDLKIDDVANKINKVLCKKRNLISVVIPTYNHYGRGTGLSNLIESLLLKSNEKFLGEIIVVDNGNSSVVDDLESVNEKNQGCQ